VSPLSGCGGPAATTAHRPRLISFELIAVEPHADWFRSKISMILSPFRRWRESVIRAVLTFFLVLGAADFARSETKAGLLDLPDSRPPMKELSKEEMELRAFFANPKVQHLQQLQEKVRSGQMSEEDADAEYRRKWYGGQ
jgi:hypothetical protein